MKPAPGSETSSDSVDSYSRSSEYVLIYVHPATGRKKVLIRWIRILETEYVLIYVHPATGRSDSVDSNSRN